MDEWTVPELEARRWQRLVEAQVRKDEASEQEILDLLRQIGEASVKVSSNPMSFEFADASYLDITPRLDIAAIETEIGYYKEQ